jgi:hypothetical protein
MSERQVIGTDPNITKVAAPLYGFIAYPEIYVKSVAEAYEKLKGQGTPHIVKSSDAALLQFIASRLGCPAMDFRQLFVPLDSIEQVELLRSVQALELTTTAYLDYEEIVAYIDGNRPAWVCFVCYDMKKALSFTRYFRAYKATPLLYIVRDGLCVYMRYKSDCYEYDRLTPDSWQLVQQLADEKLDMLSEYSRSVLVARQERLSTSQPSSFASGSDGWLEG